jgi:hypothetical protein
MSSQIYSRQYLQGLPEMKRRQTIENDVFRLFQQILQPLQAAALKGEKRYLHDMSYWESHQGTMQMIGQAQSGASGASSYELLAGLKEKFPDCSVSLQEDWVETRQGVKELKKGILIDWS